MDDQPATTIRASGANYALVRHQNGQESYRNHPRKFGLPRFLIALGADVTKTCSLRILVFNYIRYIRIPATTMSTHPTEHLVNSETTLVCANCGFSNSGVYCTNCGQKHRTPHDYKLSSFAKHVFEEFTSLDSKIFRSLKSLLFSPGKLTAEWVTGRQKSYIAPLRLFVLINIGYFLYTQVVPIDALTSPLETQWSMFPYSIAALFDRSSSRRFAHPNCLSTDLRQCMTRSPKRKQRHL